MRRCLVAVALLLLAGCAAPGANKPDFLTLKQEADTAYRSGDLKLAQEKYQVLVDEVPLEADPWFKLGNIHARLGQPEAAALAYHEALVRDPKLAKAWNNLGVVHMRQAVNAYLQLCRHAAAGDGLCDRAQQMVAGLNALLIPKEGTEASDAPVDVAPPSRETPAPTGTEPRAAEAPAPVPLPADVPPPQAPAIRDLDWLTGQEPADLFVQLSSGYAPEPLLALADRFGLSGEGYHLFRASNSRGRTYYQLLQGPFATYDEARAAVDALAAPLAALAPTIRRSGSLQALRGLDAPGAP